LRSARVDDAWRRVIEKERGFRVRRIRAIGKTPLADFDEELGNGLTVICGLNGVGKTTILRMLESTLASTDPIGRVRDDMLIAGEFIVSLERDGDELELTLGETVDGAPRVLLLDAFSLCERLQRLASQTNFDDLLVGLEPHEYGRPELETIAYVVGKNYDSVRVFEVEDPDADDAVLPAFGAVVAGVEYDFRSMGLGELAALVALWHLDRVEAGTVVLLEEPETFLSSRSTVALLNVLAERVHQRRLYALLTTHAMETVARVPLDTVRVLVPTPDGIGIRRPATRAELEHMLGAFIGAPRLVFVEDDAGGEVVAELLGRYSGIWGESIEIVGASGAAGVVDALRHLPKTTAIRAVGVLDGDQELPAEETNWPVLLLPGESAPEIFIRTAAGNNRELFADRVGRTLEDVNTAFLTADGADHHDWPTAVASSLNIGASAVIRAGLYCWLAIGENEAAAEAFVAEATVELLS
jgi:hypothetical protein